MPRFLRATRAHRCLPGLAISLFILPATVFLLSSCARTGPRYAGPPVPVREVVKWSKEDVPPTTIIERMRRSGTVYRLSASQLSNLKAEGVSDAVIDYMQQTYLHAVRRDQKLKDRRYWAEVDGYYYGGPAYWYWPDVDFGDEDLGEGFGDDSDEGFGDEGDEGDEGGNEDGD